MTITTVGTHAVNQQEGSAEQHKQSEKETMPVTGHI